MYGLEYPWALAALPLPFLVWWLLPPYREPTAAVRVPFFEEIATTLGMTPSAGAVVRRATWPQRLVAPICWVLLVAALARPARFEPPIEHVESARDLLLAIDLSQSMEARDFTTPDGVRVDRLTAVKSVVDDFITRRASDRIGLIVFGQGAFPQAPLTLDHASVRALLDETRIGMAGPQTAIGDAIGVAVKMTAPPTATDPEPPAGVAEQAAAAPPLSKKAPAERVLVLLTDGNDTASRLPPAKAAEIAKQAGITVHTVAIGNPNASGEDKVDLAALETIATTTGGRAFRAEDRAGLAEIYATIDRLAPDEAKRTLFRPRVDLYWLPLAASTLLAALYHGAALVGLALRRRPAVVTP
jgi:Ca-activated chloride channel family protein